MFTRLLPRPVIGVATFVLMLPLVVFWVGMMVPAMLLRLLPVYRLQRICARYCVWNARRWAATNRALYRWLHDLPAADAYGLLSTEGTLSREQSYVLICNHQSWADILVLFTCFHGRVPFLRFFLKRDLLYVPLVGIACWAMDFPFMTRKSAARDLDATRRACAVFREDPVTVVNFLEGTRFTEQKKREKGSPYARLLRPKSAGMSYALNAMGEQFAGLIDVTIQYQPTTRTLLWSWLCGEQRLVRVHCRLRPLPPELLHGDYRDDPDFRVRFQHWVNELWAEKAARLDAETHAPRP
jgi:1-acyl-sn-glycerol-3-phosphate acyltransferase